MKRLGLCALLMIFAYCNSKHENSNYEEIATLKVNSYIERKYDSIFSNLSNVRVPAYDIGLSIINNSDSSKSIWIMKCSWENNFIISDDYFNFLLFDCDGNFPTVKRIPPKDSLHYKTTIFSNSVSYVKTRDSLKIGFILIDEKYFNTPEDYLRIMRDKSLQTTVLWSNKIRL